MQKTKKRIKGSNIFILLNILVLLGIIGHYASRLVHYYKLEHPKIETLVNKTMSDVLTSDANVVFEGDGLYKTGDNYTFRGKDLKNYVYYSGRIWRIIGVNQDKSIKMITNDSQTSIVWGINNEYEESYIENWLMPSDEENMSGIFYNSLNNPDEYIQEKIFCKDVIIDDKVTCEDSITTKVGLISYSEYEAANGENSYLNNGTNWWTMNGSNKSTALFITDEGAISNSTIIGKTYESFGVRPVINIRGNLTIVSGDGTINNPYIFEQESSGLLKERNIGEYIKYSDYTFRILEKNDESVRVVMDGFIKENDEEVEELFSNKTNRYSSDSTQIGYYLNNDFYNSLENNENIVSSDWQIGQYNDYVNFNYTNTNYRTVSAKIGLLKVGDLFVNDYSDYSLITGESAITLTVYTINKNGSLESSSTSTKMHVRPALNLKGDLTISSGKGTKNDPYVIE